MNLLLRHSIDAFNCRYIAGWIFHSCKRTSPLRLHFVSGSERIGTIVANQLRKDVQHHTIHPSGLCGFDFNFPSGIDLRRNKTLDLYLDNRSRPFKRLSTKSLHAPDSKSLPPILFMHIPKTAGTSFNTFMRMHIQADGVENHIEQFPHDRYTILGMKKNYLAGHLPIGTLKHYFRLTKFDCFSMVRHPFHHLHSHLNWLRGIAANPRGEFFKQHNKTVQQLALKVRTLDFKNLAQVKNFVISLKAYELDFFDNCQTRYFLDYRPVKVSQSDFQQTVENIALFKHIGLTEQYGRFRDCISALYNLPVVSVPKKLNRAMFPRLYDPESSAFQEIFYPLVHADLLLYEYIRNRFQMNENALAE